MDPKIFDFEICVPVAAQVTATGRVKASQPQGVRRIAKRLAPDLWDCYGAGPASSPDPANWRTE